LTASYQSVGFNFGDDARVDKLNQMANNDQYLFEHLAKIGYRSSAINRETTIKVLAVRTPVSATDARQQRMDIYWNGFFSSGCAPICVATAIAHPQKRLNVTVSGLGGSILPDARGCMAQIEADELYGTPPGGKIANNCYIDLIAVGY
jgi:hypothetical protein